jgi:hypothetical protein
MSIANELERRRQRTLSADRFESTAMNVAADAQGFWLSMRDYAHDERVAFARYMEEIIGLAAVLGLARAPGESIRSLAERLDHLLERMT